MSGQKIGRKRSINRKPYCPNCNVQLKPVKWMGTHKKGMFWSCVDCGHEERLIKGK